MANFISQDFSRTAAKKAQILKRREKLICGVFIAFFVVIAFVVFDIPSIDTLPPLFIGFGVGYFILPLFLSQKTRNIKRVLLGGCLVTLLTIYLGSSGGEFIMAVSDLEFFYAAKSLIPHPYVFIASAVLSPFISMLTLRLDRYLFEYRQDQLPIDIITPEERNIRE
ncbi:hypothetical protein [Kiloniella sp.]|uniref:hypothetical protein n=1 Tax=Kiloniella sp. TaxID=1938587 RepID=UPI003B02A86F